MQRFVIANWLSIIPYSVDEARLHTCKFENIQLVEVTVSSNQISDCLFSISNLGHLYWFAKFLEDARAQSRGSHLLLCIGPKAEELTTCSFLVGGYFILVESAAVDQVISTFECVSSLFQAFLDPLQTMSVGEGLTVHDGWRALHRAKANGWLNFSEDDVDVDSCIDIHEYQHYDNPLNGYLHVIIPSRLIAISTPSNLAEIPAESNGQWCDLEGRRFFGPDFYADILSVDFDVELIVHCDSNKVDEEGDRSVHNESDCDYEDSEFEDGVASTSCDDSGFERRGMAVERLVIGRGGGIQPSGALLRDVDRFLTLARLAPGAIAIHGDGGPGLGCGGELLVSSLLIKRHGFDARSALAWTRMAHPPAVPRSLAFSLAPRSAEPAAAARPSHHKVRRNSAPALLLCPEPVIAATPEDVKDPASKAVGGDGGSDGFARCESAPGLRRHLLPDSERGPSASAPDVFDRLAFNHGPPVCH